jgi:LacI family transcriptional regulator
MAMVAEHAGVSPMTVSNVINGHRVHPDTRDLVLASVKALDYVPNPAARALAKASVERVGLLYHSVENAYLSTVLVNALNAATRLGAQLLIRSFDYDGHETPLDAIRALIATGARAILLPPPFCEIVSRTDIADTVEIPLIGLSPGSDLASMASVRIDDFGAACEMTELLIGHGHRRIGFIRAPETHTISTTRRDGYLQALTKHGLVPDPRLVVDGSLSFDSGIAAAQTLLDLPDPPTAIFASNDDMAAAVVSVAHRRGLRVPEDLSVAGFDDSSIALKIWPPLTTVRQPVGDMAGLAMTQLVEAIRRRPGEDSLDLRTTHVRHTIIERSSTGPCR